MLKSLFKKKPNAKELQVKPAEVEYLGDISGTGVQVLRFEIAKLISEGSNAERYIHF